MLRGNGNKFKKKSANRRKKKTATYDDNLDNYAKVIDRAGSVYINVLPHGNAKDDIVKARIPGKFRKKVWFNPDDYVVIRQVADNVIEIQGKIEDRDKNHVRKLFGNDESRDKGGFMIGSNSDDDDNAEGANNDVFVFDDI